MNNYRCIQKKAQAILPIALQLSEKIKKTTVFARVYADMIGTNTPNIDREINQYVPAVRDMLVEISELNDLLNNELVKLSKKII